MAHLHKAVNGGVHALDAVEVAIRPRDDAAGEVLA